MREKETLLKFRGQVLSREIKPAGRQVRVQKAIRINCKLASERESREKRGNDHLIQTMLQRKPERHGILATCSVSSGVQNGRKCELQFFLQFAE